MSTTAIIVFAVGIGILLLSLGLKGIRRLIFLCGAAAAIILGLLVVDGKLTLTQVISTVRQFWERKSPPPSHNIEEKDPAGGKKQLARTRGLAERLNALAKSLRLNGPANDEDREDIFLVRDSSAPTQERVDSLRRVLRRGTALTAEDRPFDEPALQALINSSGDN